MESDIPTESRQKTFFGFGTADSVIAFVGGSQGGGVQVFIQWAVSSLQDAGVDGVVLEINPHSQSISFLDPEGDALAPKWVLEHGINELENLLFVQLKIQHFHVHSLLGTFAALRENMMRWVDRFGAGYDVSIHDFEWVCPRVNFVDFTRRYCGEPSVDQCEICISIGDPIIPVDSVSHYRDVNREFLTRARRVFAFSQDAANRIERNLDLGRAIVIPDGLPTLPGLGQKAFSSKGRSEKKCFPDLPIATENSIAILGNVTIHKGSELALDVATILEGTRPDIAIEIFGSTDRDADFERLGNTRIHGAYPDDGVLVDWLLERQPGIIWFPAVWPETFSYTLSVAMECQATVVAFDLGAFLERLESYQHKVLLEYELMLQPEKISEILVAEVRSRKRKLVVPGLERKVVSAQELFAYPTYN